MPQYAWVLEVKPGYEEEYVRRHREIWPEMLDALHEAGISNYSIFRHGLTLFGYRFERWLRFQVGKCVRNRTRVSCLRQIDRATK